MKIISHRGNLEGRIPEDENNPDYIHEAIESGFDVEIDLWLYENGFYLGHDEPQYQIDLKFLKNERLWVHAKSMETAEFLYKQPIIHKEFFLDCDDSVRFNVAHSRTAR